MERFLFPETSMYQRAWRELGALKFERALDSRTCWRTDDFKAVVRCVVPDAPIHPASALWHDGMVRLLGPRMDQADATFGERIPALLDERNLGREKHWDLSSVAVEPDSQRQGTGSALVRYVVEQAEIDGCAVALVASSPESRRLYERLGFWLVGEVAVAGGPTLFPMSNA